MKTTIFVLLVYKSIFIIHSRDIDLDVAKFAKHINQVFDDFTNREIIQSYLSDTLYQPQCPHYIFDKVAFDIGEKFLGLRSHLLRWNEKLEKMILPSKSHYGANGEAGDFEGSDSLNYTSSRVLHPKNHSSVDGCCQNGKRSIDKEALEDVWREMNGQSYGGAIPYFVEAGKDTPTDTIYLGTDDLNNFSIPFFDSNSDSSDYLYLNTDKNSQKFSVIILEILYDSIIGSSSLLESMQKVVNYILDMHGQTDKVTIAILLKNTDLPVGINSSFWELYVPWDHYTQIPETNATCDDYFPFRHPYDKDNEPLLITMDGTGSRFLRNFLDRTLRKIPKMYENSEPGYKNLTRFLDMPFQLSYDMIRRTLNEEITPFTGSSFIHFITNRVAYEKDVIQRLNSVVLANEILTGLSLVTNAILFHIPHVDELYTKSEAIFRTQVDPEKVQILLVEDVLKALVSSDGLNKYFAGLGGNANDSTIVNEVGTFIKMEIGHKKFDKISLLPFVTQPHRTSNLSNVNVFTFAKYGAYGSLDFAIPSYINPLSTGGISRDPGNGQKVFGVMGLITGIDSIFREIICPRIGPFDFSLSTTGFLIFVTDVAARVIWHPSVICGNMDTNKVFKDHPNPQVRHDLTMYFEESTSYHILNEIKSGDGGKYEVDTQRLSPSLLIFGSPVTVNWERIDPSPLILGIITVDNHPSVISCTDKENHLDTPTQNSLFKTNDHSIRGYFYRLEDILSNLTNQEPVASTNLPNFLSRLLSRAYSDQGTEGIRRNRRLPDSKIESPVDGAELSPSSSELLGSDSGNRTLQQYVIRIYMTALAIDYGYATGTTVIMPITTNPHLGVLVNGSVSSLPRSDTKPQTFVLFNGINPHFFLKDAQVPYYDTQIDDTGIVPGQESDKCIHFSTQSLDPLGIGFMVTASAGLLPNRPKLTLGIDFTATFLTKFLVQNFRACDSRLASSITATKCFLMNHFGYILAHTDDVRPRHGLRGHIFSLKPKFRHVVHMEPHIFLNYLTTSDKGFSISGFKLRKLSCSKFSKQTTKTLYRIHRVKKSKPDPRARQTCLESSPRVDIKRLEGTNLYLVIVSDKNEASVATMSNDIVASNNLDLNLNANFNTTYPKLCEPTSFAPEKIPIFCPCSRSDDTCFDCDRNLAQTFINCECPCECPLIDNSSVPTCSMGRRSLTPLPPCPANHEGMVSPLRYHPPIVTSDDFSRIQKYFASHPESISSSPDRCSRYRNYWDCFAVVDCEWCMWNEGGIDPLTQGFCSRQRLCFGGIMNAPSPYHTYHNVTAVYYLDPSDDSSVVKSRHDYYGGKYFKRMDEGDIFSPLYTATFKDTTTNKVPSVAIICGLAGFVFCVALVVYFYRSTHSMHQSRGRRHLYSDQTEDLATVTPTTTDPGYNRGCDAPSTSKKLYDHGDNRIEFSNIASANQASISPYQINATYQKGSNLGSDNGYSTMTAPDDSEIATNSSSVFSEVSSAFKKRRLKVLGENVGKKLGTRSIFKGKNHRGDHTLTLRDGNNFSRSSLTGRTVGESYANLGNKKPVSYYTKYKENFLKDLKLSGKVIFTDIQEEILSSNQVGDKVLESVGGMDLGLDPKDTAPIPSLKVQELKVPVQFHRSFEGI